MPFSSPEQRRAIFARINRETMNTITPQPTYYKTTENFRFWQLPAETRAEFANFLESLLLPPKPETPTMPSNERGITL